MYSRISLVFHNEFSSNDSVGLMLILSLFAIGQELFVLSDLAGRGQTSGRQEAGRSWGLLVGLVEELLDGGQAWPAGGASCWLPGGRHDWGSSNKADLDGEL